MRIVASVFMLMSAGVLGAQEGARTLPNNYQVQFENAWVKVTSVRYGPRQKLAPHTHTPHAAAYVYLNDGPPVIFRHVGGKGVAATRPATKAGAFRVYRGLEEVHEVENTGDSPSEFLRVELKTAPLQPGSFFGKFERPATPSAEPVAHFNHPQVMISRVWIAPNHDVAITATTQPVLVVALASGTALARGETMWLDASGQVRLRNASAAAIDVLRFDLKTGPQPTR